MNRGKLVFAQVTQHVPLAARYSGEHNVKCFSRLDQFRCMAFAERKARDSCLGRHFDDAGKRHDDTLQVRG
jgi:hypothetical protein